MTTGTAKDDAVGQSRSTVGLGWKPMDTAPTDGTIIIGLGYHPAKKKESEDPRCMEGRSNIDVRLIEGWKPWETVHWRAQNEYGMFTVGFYPTAWMEYHPPND